MQEPIRSCNAVEKAVEGGRGDKSWGGSFSIVSPDYYPLLRTRRPSGSPNSMKCLQPLRAALGAAIVGGCYPFHEPFVTDKESGGGLRPIANIRGSEPEGLHCSLSSVWRALSFILVNSCGIFSRREDPR